MSRNEIEKSNPTQNACSQQCICKSMADQSHLYSSNSNHLLFKPTLRYWTFVIIFNISFSIKHLYQAVQSLLPCLHKCFNDISHLCSTLWIKVINLLIIEETKLLTARYSFNITYHDIMPFSEHWGNNHGGCDMVPVKAQEYEFEFKTTPSLI